MKRIVLLVFVLFVLAACGFPHPQGVVFRTADPNLSILFLIPQAEVIPAEEVGEVLPDPTPEPPAIVVKGNISNSGEKIYHLPGGAYYDQVKIDESAGEMFFESEQEAIDAGFRKSSR